MFDLYTERAKVAIFFAKHLANSYNAFEIEPEHIFLGLVKADPKLFELLSPSGNDGTEVIRVRIHNNLMTTFSEDKKAPDEIPLSNDSKKALSLAHQQSIDLKQDYVGSEHLLLGLLKDSVREEYSFFSFKPKYFLSFLGQVLQDYGLTIELIQFRIRDGSLTRQDNMFKK